MKLVAGNKHLPEILVKRYDCFPGCPQVIDPFDRKAQHIAIREGGDIIASTRFLVSPDSAYHSWSNQELSVPEGEYVELGRAFVIQEYRHLAIFSLLADYALYYLGVLDTDTVIAGAIPCSFTEKYMMEIGAQKFCENLRIATPEGVYAHLNMYKLNLNNETTLYFKLQLKQRLFCLEKRGYQVDHSSFE